MIFILKTFFLILRLRRRFFDNLKSQHYPSHVIKFFKQDLLKIKAIQSCNVNLREVNLNFSSKYLSNIESLGKINYYRYFNYHIAAMKYRNS